MRIYQEVMPESSGGFGRRVKMPDGLKEHCCRFVRSCMHADPNSRPTAKMLTEWLDDCRKVLQLWINDKATSKIKGSGESRLSYEAINGSESRV